MRDQIVEYLRINRSATVSGLASGLHLTHQDVRYNLKLLLAEGIIEKYDSTPERKGRGRPAARLRITVKAQPNNFADLAAGLLKSYFDPAANSQDMAVSRLSRLVFGSTYTGVGSALQKINNLIEQLCAHEYMAHWEAHATGPRIILENCPYAKIIRDYPQLCQMDREFICQFSGMQTELLQTFDTSSRKPPACIFRLML